MDANFINSVYDILDDIKDKEDNEHIIKFLNNIPDVIFINAYSLEQFKGEVVKCTEITQSHSALKLYNKLIDGITFEMKVIASKN